MRKDATNLASLTCIQAFNAAIPLIIFPFALRTVGTDLYAKIATTEAITFVVLTIVLYSFEVDAVSRVVDRKLTDDLEEISRIFSTVLFFRLGLFIASILPALVAVHWLAPDLQTQLLWWSLVPLSYILQSLWLFQGLERNLPAAAIVASGRVLCLCLIIGLVDGPEDAHLVAVFVGSSFLLSGASSLIYVLSRFKIRLQSVPLSSFKEYAWSGKEIFLGNLSVMLYRDVNLLVLGAVHAGAEAIATYSIAEKLIKGLQAAMRPFNQLFYPKAVRAIREARAADRTAFAIILHFTIPQMIALACLIIATATLLAPLREFLTSKVANPFQITDIAKLLIVMLPAVFIGIANFMLGTAGLNHLNERPYFFRSILTAGILSVGVSLALGWRFGAIGAAIAMVVGEAVLLLLIMRKFLR